MISTVLSVAHLATTASTDIALAGDFAIIIIVATAIGIGARQLGQPTIVAYIITGVVLGPVVFDVVSDEGLVGVIAELGLGFLLFLLGLKMRFGDIRDILRPITNIAIGQTILQTALALTVAVLLGFQTTEVVVIALATVFGATPVIVKVLTDKGEITTLPGRIDVGVLIIQDIYLVVILALFGADQLGNPQEIAVTLGVILAMMSFIGVFSAASSRYLLPRLFKRIADHKDVFLIVAVAWAFLFIAIAEAFDLSVEVGAFLAGLSLAQLPYSNELQDRITPITDFFILVFFASIGLQIESVQSLLTYWQEAVIASGVLMIGNFWIMFYLIDREGFGIETSFLGSINMVQVSEFSLVVGALALQQGYIGADVLGYLTLMALLTMTVSTYIIMYNHAIYDRLRPWLQRIKSDKSVDQELPGLEGHAVVVGYDEVSERALPVLEEAFTEAVVVDRSTDHIARLRERGEYQYLFGDIRHKTVRKEAQLSTAAFVLSSSAQPAINETLLAETGPDTVVFVEATRITNARKLYNAGADYVLMTPFLTAERLSDLLGLYVTDRGRFEDRIEREVEWIQRRVESPSPQREVTPHVDADLRTFRGNDD